MLNLNLLPPEEKRRLQYTIWTRAVIAIGGGLSLGLGVFIVLLLPAWLFLKAEEPALFDALTFERRAYSQAAPGVASDVRTLNRLARFVDEHAGRRVPAYALITEVLRVTPAPIRLQEVVVQASPGELRIAGFSATRQALLTFIQSLEGNPRIASVSSPLSNLVRETNITFTLTAKLR